MPKYSLFLAKLKGEGRPFWNWEKHSLILWNFSYMVGGSNAIYYKSFHHPIPTQGNREHPGNFQIKSEISSFSWVSKCVLFLSKYEGRVRPFSKGARRGTTLWDFPPRVLRCHKRWKRLSFCEIWNNSTPLLFFIRHLY